VFIGKVFGPLHFSRHDLAVLTIMRGRDHGVLDYNSARVAYGLPAVADWTDINPWLNDANPRVRTIASRCSEFVDKTAVQPFPVVWPAAGRTGQKLFSCLLPSLAEHMYCTYQSQWPKTAKDHQKLLPALHEYLE